MLRAGCSGWTAATGGGSGGYFVASGSRRLVAHTGGVEASYSKQAGDGQVLYRVTADARNAIGTTCHRSDRETDLITRPTTHHLSAASLCNVRQRGASVPSWRNRGWSRRVGVGVGCGSRRFPEKCLWRRLSLEGWLGGRPLGNAKRRWRARCDDPALAARSELLGPRNGASIYGPIEIGGAVLLVSPLLLTLQGIDFYFGEGTMGWVRIFPVKHVPSLPSPLPLSEWMDGCFFFSFLQAFPHRHIRTLLRLGQT